MQPSVVTKALASQVSFSRFSCVPFFFFYYAGNVSIVGCVIDSLVRCRTEGGTGQQETGKKFPNIIETVGFDLCSKFYNVGYKLLLNYVEGT